jgi:hypothetical protein
VVFNAAVEAGDLPAPPPFDTFTGYNPLPPLSPSLSAIWNTSTPVPSAPFPHSFVQAVTTSRPTPVSADSPSWGRKLADKSAASFPKLASLGVRIMPVDLNVGEEELLRLLPPLVGLKCVKVGSEQSRQLFFATENDARIAVSLLEGAERALPAPNSPSFTERLN